MLTDFENSFTVGNSNKLFTKIKYNTSRHFLKTLLHYRAKHNKRLSYRRETALQGAL